MPINQRAVSAPAPLKPHFALLMDEDGRRLPIPPGASLWVVEDKNQPEKIFPLVLAKVSHKAIVFEMTGADGATTEYTYKLTSAKPLSRAALQKLVQNRGGAPTIVQK